MKRVIAVLLCCLTLFLMACNRTNQNYEAGITSLDAKDYKAAESSLKKAIDEGYNKDNINEIYTIVSEYNSAKKSYDSGEYDKSQAHIDLIPASYSGYTIGTDIDELKDQIKNYKDGMANLEIKNYPAAEACFKKLLEKDPDKNDINLIYTIVSEYNFTKKYYDKADYDAAITHLDKIPNSYSSYSIGADVEVIKGQLKNIRDIDIAITKAKNLLESGEYNEANEVILKIDTQYSTDKQSEEISSLQKQIKIKKKNDDPIVLDKIKTLVRTYANGLCEAVNTDNFKPLNGTLYYGSSIYKEQVSYIAKMANQEIYEYCESAEVTSVNWTTDTDCVISTIETYEIYNLDNEDYSTQTFRYTYDVIETSDGQLFLTSIRKSN